LPTHAGRVKCIYIDPPYNTGNEGWVYNDNLTQPQFKEWIGQTVGKEGEDACRHDKWCCMMYPRLMLLKELLRDDGSIWVSIGEDEVHRLRELLDELFGNDNFVATIVWRNSTGPKQSNYLSTSHDYIICYAKNLGSWKRNLLPRTPEQEADYTNPDNDSRGPWRSGGLDARNYYSRGRYPITCPGGRIIDGPPGESYWRFPEDTLWELDADGRIWWGEDGNNVPRVKRFLSEVQQGLIPQTVWDHLEVGHTQEAKQEVIRILGGTDAPVTPKPVALLDRICHIATQPGDIVLDSFAGTGTTAHAVLAENAERKAERTGGRRFVIVQQPHDTKDDIKERRNICQTLTTERVRRVIEGYTYTKRGPKGKTSKAKEAGLGGSFTYARVGEPLFGEYRDLGDKLPPFEDLAKYIFYTDALRQCDVKRIDEKTGFIGETEAAGGTSYYLLYTPNHREDREVSVEWLEETAQRDKNRSWVVYTERIWMDPEDKTKFEREHDRRVRFMIVPFNLK